MAGSSLSATSDEMPSTFSPAYGLPVQGGVDAVGDQPAVPEQVVADDRRGRAVDEERVAPSPPVDLGRSGRRPMPRMKNRSSPSAASTSTISTRTNDDVQPGPEHAVLGDDEVVVELGADDDDRVEPVAAVDVDRGVDRVLDQVGAGVAADVGPLAQVLLRPDQGERPDQEAVVPVVAVQDQRRQVVVDDELVVVARRRRWSSCSLMPLDRNPRVVSMVANTSACPARRLAGVALRLVELADLEEVLARRRRRCRSWPGCRRCRTRRPRPARRSSMLSSACRCS